MTNDTDPGTTFFAVDPTRQIEIGVTRDDAVILRVVLETHMLTHGESEPVRRLHNLFASMTLHTARTWPS